MDFLSPATGGLGRGTLWPLGPAVCRRMDVLQDWSASEMLPQAAVELCAGALIEEGHARCLPQEAAPCAVATKEGVVRHHWGQMISKQQPPAAPTRETKESK